MKTHKIDTNSLLGQICRIFHAESKDVALKTHRAFFDIELTYRDVLIHIYTDEEQKNHEAYQQIEIKKESDEYVYHWTPFWLLYAYHENQSLNMAVDAEFLLFCLLKLKYYIDSGEVFFEYHGKDFSKRYFLLKDEVKELPKITDPATETELRFGADARKIKSNRAYISYQGKR